MYKLSCRLLSMDCSFEAEGDTEQQIMEHIRDHIHSAHPEMLEGRSEEELTELMRENMERA